MRAAGGQRVWRHLTMTRRERRRWFPDTTLQAITTAVRASEATHGGEIRVAIEADWSLLTLLRGISARERAQQVFVSLAVANTAQRNGVLIYVCLAERAVEIVADVGLDNHITAAQWQAIAAQMEASFHQHQAQKALTVAIDAIGQVLAAAFPKTDSNEQSDQPVLL